MRINNISSLLNLKGVFVKNIINHDNLIEIFVETKKKKQICPYCGNITSKVHDYRTQRIKDLPIHSTHSIIVLRKRRYVCSCGKKFYEKLSFLPKYHRMTSRVYASIVKSLKSNYSIKSIAESFNISSTTVIRILKLLNYSCFSLPEVLCIDEFKGHSGGAKYHCILVDPVNRNVLDILKDRKTHVLSAYFRNFKDRSRVRYFITDMWRPYVDIAKTYFKNATIVIDKYHYTRYNIWAIEGVRKRIQKSLPHKLRKYFKRSKKLILARKDSLDDESKKELEIMLLYSEDLRQAHYIKELFYEFTEAKSSVEARELLIKWIKIARSSGIKEYVSCANTLSNWINEIANSFDVPYTNGCIEGFNNKIKVIKRNAFGFRNFENFRTRILHCCN